MYRSFPENGRLFYGAICSPNRYLLKRRFDARSGDRLVAASSPIAEELFEGGMN
jgi:hypothetical protein